MTHTEAEQKIREITETLSQQFDPEKLILFGSRAWGTPDENSDFDVVMIKKDVPDTIEMMRDVSRAFIGKRCPLDVLIYTPEEIEYRRYGDLFVRQVLEEGKVLYEKTHYAG